MHTIRTIGTRVRLERIFRYRFEDRDLSLIDQRCRECDKCHLVIRLDTENARRRLNGIKKPVFYKKNHDLPVDYAVVIF